MTDKPEEKSSVPDPDLRETKDGSHTLYSHRFNQHYHNPNGAVAESKHNFFETNGLLDDLPGRDRANILEVGFGTGLNLLLLADYWLQLKSRPAVHFCSLEGFPVDPHTASKFNYSQFLEHRKPAEKVTELFCGLEKGFNTTDFFPDFRVTLFYGLFEEFEYPHFKADYIFHDPFSPAVNESLWTAETFTKLKQMSSREVLLTTYSAASKAKGAMAYAGWNIARAPGALGKREMTVAALDPDRLEPFKRADEQRLSRRYEQDDF